MLPDATEPAGVLPMTGNIKVRAPGEEFYGSCLQGYITVTYAALVERFGTPGENDGYKEDAQWCLEFPGGHLATIYNYKTGRNYLGDEGLDVEDITDWHIGGHTDEVVGLVHAAMAEVAEREPEPPHDGPEEPLPEPELPADGEVLALSRPVEMTTLNGRVRVTLPAGAPVTCRGPLVPGGDELEITAALPLLEGLCVAADLRPREISDPDGEEEGR